MDGRITSVEGRGDPVASIAALNEPLRQRIYQYVVAHPGGVNRDDTAEAIGVARSVAAFHLDKLLEVGLVEVEYKRPAGVGGPGAGRPAKWYRRTDQEVALSLPCRRYDLASAILAEALERAAATPMSPDEAIRQVAAEEGRRIGITIRPDDKKPTGARTLARRLTDLLAEHGYEPHLENGVITLANCPFHRLAEQHRDLVCTMNHTLLRSAAEAAGIPPDSAKLDPAQDRCCVTLSV